MKVYPHIFLSRNELPVEGARPLEVGLKAAAAGSDQFVVISAYYGAAYLKEMFLSFKRADRKACRLTLVFGLDNDARLGSATQELRDLASALRKGGYPKPDVRLLVGLPVPFHVKLYYAKRATQPLWFIGSANASGAIGGDRHEMMVRLSGKHAGLSDYRDEVIRRSTSIAEVSEGTGVAYDLRSFFLRGSLCFRPLNRASFTFEACKIEAEHRRIFERGLAEQSRVPHAAPKTAGFGFGLVEAVKAITGVADLGSPDSEYDADKKIQRLKLRNRCVETNFGYWMPRSYVDDIAIKLEEVVAEGRRTYLKLGASLASIDTERLEKELDAYVEGLKGFFEARKIAIATRRGYREKFREFITSRRSLLADEQRVSRLVNRLKMEPMPDIWSDIVAAEDFENSFFDDLSFLLTSNTKNWVAGQLKMELEGYGELDAPIGVRTALIERLRRGLFPSAWGMQDDFENEDDE